MDRNLRFYTSVENAMACPRLIAARDDSSFVDALRNYARRFREANTPMMNSGDVVDVTMKYNRALGVSEAGVLCNKEEDRGWWYVERIAAGGAESNEQCREGRVKRMCLLKGRKVYPCGMVYMYNDFRGCIGNSSFLFTKARLSCG